MAFQQKTESSSYESLLVSRKLNVLTTTVKVLDVKVQKSVKNESVAAVLDWLIIIGCCQLFVMTSRIDCIGHHLGLFFLQSILLALAASSSDPVGICSQQIYY